MLASSGNGSSGLILLGCIYVRGGIRLVLKTSEASDALDARHTKATVTDKNITSKNEMPR